MKWKLELTTFQNSMTWVWKSVIWQLTLPRLSLPLATSSLWFSCPGLKTLTNVFYDAGSDLINASGVPGHERDLRIPNTNYSASPLMYTQV